MTRSYMQAWVAMEFNLTPMEFNLLPWAEQDELTAFFMVKRKIDQFYQQEHRRKIDEMRNQAAQKSASQGGRNR